MPEIVEQQEFIIDNPGKADWAVRKIKEARQRRDLFIDAAKSNIEQANAQIKEAADQCDGETSYLIHALNAYMDTVPAKEAKTQASFTLPSGKLIRKFPKLDYQRNDDELLAFLKGSDPSMVKTKESVDWAALKKDLTVHDGLVVRESTGEILDCITAVEVPESFDVT